MKTAGLLMWVAFLGMTACSSTQKAGRAPVYHTFNWVTPEVARQLELNDPKIDFVTSFVRVVQRPETEEHARGLIEEALLDKGFVRSTADQPDFYVTFYARAKDDDWVSSWSGNTPGVNDVPLVIFPGLKRTEARSYRSGIVYLTVYDAKSRKATWSKGVDVSELGPNLGSAEAEQTIQNLVEQFAKETPRGDEG